jgi:hypothetical protein
MSIYIYIYIKIHFSTRGMRRKVLVVDFCGALCLSTCDTKVKDENGRDVVLFPGDGK